MPHIVKTCWSVCEFIELTAGTGSFGFPRLAVPAAPDPLVGCVVCEVSENVGPLFVAAPWVSDAGLAPDAIPDVGGTPLAPGGFVKENEGYPV